MSSQDFFKFRSGLLIKPGNTVWYELPTTRVCICMRVCIYIDTHIHIYSFAIVHLGAFCIENAPTLVATRFCPVATGAHSGCYLFPSGCN
jgi:hypothetical protein